MTAEVGVLNRVGVALAADSAVTIGRDAYKIYTSADKLFQLSSAAPVGIMIYGNASFGGMPWETLIKQCRADSGDITFSTLAEYADQFIGYLRNAKTIFDAEHDKWQASELIGGILTFVREELRERIDAEAEEKDGLDDDDVKALAKVVVDVTLEFARQRPYLPGFDKSFRDRLSKRYRPLITEIRKEVFGTLPLMRSTVTNIHTLVMEMLTRHCFGDSKSGIVIAGFGDDEYTPSLLAYEFEEMFGGRPRCIQALSERISRTSIASVVPFAQQEMVQSFMEGVQRELLSYMQDTTERLFSGAVEEIIKIVEAQSKPAAESLRQKVAPQLDSLTGSLFQSWKDKSHRFWHPVVQVVASLPKDELAAMAEALVNLTKFRRRVTNVKETVGGPIDVAVITKGDGFVWIRRKHYFDPSLNPRVIARYQKDVAQ